MRMLSGVTMLKLVAGNAKSSNAATVLGGIEKLEHQKKFHF